MNTPKQQKPFFLYIIISILAVAVTGILLFLPVEKILLRLDRISVSGTGVIKFFFFGIHLLNEGVQLGFVIGDLPGSSEFDKENSGNKEKTSQDQQKNARIQLFFHDEKSFLII